MDWARTRLWDGDSSPRLGEAYAALARQADQARQQENREFGRLLAGWPGSGLHDRSLLGVEAVLDRRGTVPQRNLDAFAVGLDAFYTAVGEELASVGGPYSPRTALNFARRGAVYLVITGTPAFFEGPQGVRRLPPLAQRLAVDFSGAPRFDNPRACRCDWTTSTSRGSRVSGGRFAISMPGALPLRRVSSWSRQPA